MSQAIYPHNTFPPKRVIYGNHIKGHNQRQGPCSWILLNVWPPMTSAWHKSQILCTSSRQPVSSPTRHPQSACTTAPTIQSNVLARRGVSWESSLEFQCAYGLCCYTLNPVADHDCCTDQPAATSLPHFCYPSCCSGLLFTCTFTCMLSLYANTDCVTTAWGKWQHLCTTPFSSWLQGLQLKEREGSERAGGKKEGTVFLTHTALSFCSVTLLRSAGRPFSQFWNTAKKAVSYRLYLHHRCFNSMHVSLMIINTNHKNSTLHARSALSLQGKCFNVLIHTVCKHRLPKQHRRGREERKKQEG